MQHTYDNQKIAELFFAPVGPLLEACAHQRLCPELSDWQWVRMGIERVIKDERSGRSFLQDWAMGEGRETPVQVSHFFQSLKSPRRLRLVEELSRTLAAAMPSHPCSLVPQIEELAKIDLYAGDGHYHAASAHDQPIKGKRRAVGHFYTLNLRSHGLTHLTACDLQGGRKKAEHDMHALKRLSIAQLRQGAAKGRQVLYIWDRAGIDLRQWHRWKQAGGLYFLSRAKENLKITRYGGIDFDREDPLNAGVLSDEQAATETAGVMCRYIRYRCPPSGTADAFITNQMKIRPGGARLALPAPLGHREDLRHLQKQTHRTESLGRFGHRQDDAGPVPVPGAQPHGFTGKYHAEPVRSRKQQRDHPCAQADQADPRDL